MRACVRACGCYVCVCARARYDDRVDNLLIYVASSIVYAPLPPIYSCIIHVMSSWKVMQYTPNYVLRMNIVIVVVIVE